MTDLSLLSYFLGMEVVQHSRGIFVSQQKYALQLLDHFIPTDPWPVATPLDPTIKLSKDVNSPIFDEHPYC